MNGLYHGQGTFKNPCGVYEGDFKKGMMEGKGIMDFCNGDKYTGEFQQSTITGYGCYQYEGIKLTGHFTDGVCNKHGKKVYPDGTVYLGEFKNDVEHGKGILTPKVGGQQIKGLWCDGKLT